MTEVPEELRFDRWQFERRAENFPEGAFRPGYSPKDAVFNHMLSMAHIGEDNHRETHATEAEDAD